MCSFLRPAPSPLPNPSGALTIKDQHDRCTDCAKQPFAPVTQMIAFRGGDLAAQGALDLSPDRLVQRDEPGHGIVNSSESHQSAHDDDHDDMDGDDDDDDDDNAPFRRNRQWTGERHGVTERRRTSVALASSALICCCTLRCQLSDPVGATSRSTTKAGNVFGGTTTLRFHVSR
uniref:Uncharacterized protein n=1 Tax=Anopheles merus TaxID=30066 RepID=A0A182VJ87_ANOME